MSAVPDCRGQLEVFGGTAHPELAQEIAACLGVPLGPMNVSRFPDGEIHVRIDTSVRGKDVFLVQPTCPPVNENFTELLIILDAMRRASPARITAIIPYYGYARQDKKTAGREPITARMIADVITTGGASRMLTVDLHSPQIQGFFAIPVDHLSAMGVLCEEIGSWNLENAVAVAPDAGRVHAVTMYANRLGLPVVIIHKRRLGPEQTEVTHVVGDVHGKRPIVIDDMITTGGTIDRSVDALLGEGAEPEISIVATHAVFAGKATQYLSRPEVKRVLVTNTVPVSQEKRFESLTVVSIAPLISDAMTRVHKDMSVSELFLGTS